MKRRVVQHGPSTLTISLPARWVRAKSIQKGMEIDVEQLKDGLLLTASGGVQQEAKHLSIRGLDAIIPKAIAALYKGGYDEVVIEYGTPQELERVHFMIRTGCVGFEIIDETKTTVTIRKVSDFSEAEFKPLFRRLFHFLVNTSDDSLDAARGHDTVLARSLVLRDENINKIADICRRIINTQRQQQYRNDTAIYHIIEELEKIGDHYKIINTILAERKTPSSEPVLRYYAAVNALLHQYHELFFRFSIEQCEQIYNEIGRIENENVAPRKDEERVLSALRNIVNDLSDLIGTTMILHL